MTRIANGTRVRYHDAANPKRIVACTIIPLDEETIADLADDEQGTDGIYLLSVDPGDPDRHSEIVAAGCELEILCHAHEACEEKATVFVDLGAGGAVYACLPHAKTSDVPLSEWVEIDDTILEEVSP